MMRYLVALLPAVIIFASYAYAAPALSGAFPGNNSFVKGGSINFSVNASGQDFDSGSAALYLISKNAYSQGESWDRFSLSCAGYSSDNWLCRRTISFAIAGSDTPELFYFSANSTDGSAGYIGSLAEPMRFTLDRNPPLLGIAAPAGGSYVSGNVTIRLSASDTASGINASSMQFSLDNVSWNDAPGGAGNWSSLLYQNNQTVNIYARVRDNVGNLAENMINVSVDNEAPEMSIALPSSGQTLTGLHTFQLKALDRFSGMGPGGAAVRIGSGSYQMSCAGKGEYNCSVVVDTASQADGAYNTTFTASDIAGNSNATGIPMALKNSRPAIAISVQDGSLLRGVVPVNVSVAKPDNIIENISLYLENSLELGLMDCNSGFSFCTYALDTKNIKDGQYTLAALAGNTMNYSIRSSAGITIDNTKPSVSIGSPGILNGVVEVTAIVADDNPDDKNVTLKAGSVALVMPCLRQDSALTCRHKYDSSKLSDGNNSLEVTAADRLGNAYTASRNVSVDNKPPELGFLKVEPIQSDSPKEIRFTVGLREKGSKVRSAKAIIRQGDFSATLDLVSAPPVWYGKAIAVSYGAHMVGIQAEDDSGNSAVYENKGYFYIGKLPCGDAVCQPGENYCLCQKDCGGPSCNENEAVECGSGLPACGGAPACGDSICSSKETCQSCAADCGSCDAIKAAEKIIDQGKGGEKTDTDVPGEIVSVFNSLVSYLRNQPLAVVLLTILIFIAVLFLFMRGKKPHFSA